MDYDILFCATQEPENAGPTSAKQNHEIQWTTNPEIQKARNPEIQECSDMSC